jgi:hypothetical protein
MLGVLPGLPRQGQRAGDTDERLVDRDMSVDGARQLWMDLCAQGWRRVPEQELNASRMSHRRLREMAYQR